MQIKSLLGLKDLLAKNKNRNLISHKSTTRAAARAKDLGAKLIAFAFSSNGAFSRKSQDFFKRVFHHAKLRGLSHMGISFPKADTSWTSKFFSTYWRQRLVCCMCGTSAHLVLKTLAGDALVEASLKTGARGARDFVHSYGRDGFVTPIATLARTDRQTIAQGENKWIKI